MKKVLFLGSILVILCFTQNLIAQAITYGTQLHIKNGYGSGTYLDVCGVSKCASTTQYEVLTSTEKNRDRGSGIWILESASGKASGSPVLIGDEVYIKNTYATDTYLDACGNASCSTSSKFGVVTNSSNQRDRQSPKWQIVSKNGEKNGTALTFGSAVHLKNLLSYNGSASYLDACGFVKCGTSTKYGVYTSTEKDRDKGSGTWTFEKK